MKRENCICGAANPVVAIKCHNCGYALAQITWPPRSGPQNSEESHEAWEYVPRVAARFCGVPPHGLTWFHGYDPGRHGPLVDCGYPVAKYPIGLAEAIGE